MPNLSSLTAFFATASLYTSVQAGWNGPGFSIPDNTSAGVNSSLVSNQGGVMTTGLAVVIQMSHTWVGDLVATITHDDGNTVRTATLFNRIGATISAPWGYATDFNPNTAYIFEDTGANLWSAAATQPLIFGGSYRASTNLFGPTVASNYSPVNLDAVFQGQARAGTWTLWMSDNGPTDTGSVIGWDITYNISPAPGALSLFGLAALASPRRRRT